jgi:poly(hydroxyalkanoate) depolymerase family esterase
LIGEPMRWLAACVVVIAGVPVMAAAQGGPPAGTVRVERLPGGDTTRMFRVFVPSRTPPAGARPMLVLLHGCTQDAADIARGTRLDAWAAREGFVAVYPQQETTHHPQKCWTWYDPAHTTRDRGEAAWIAAVVRHVADAEQVDPRRISIAGISAGGAMAVNLAVAYPDLFAAVGAHSALPALAAANVVSALGVMRQGPRETPDVLATRALEAMGGRARAMPLVAWHGATDAVVHPTNTDVLGAQFRVMAARLGAAATVEVRQVVGVGHAWSGGAPEGTYTAASPDDATAAFVAFLLAQRRP